MYKSKKWYNIIKIEVYKWEINIIEKIKTIEREFVKFVKLYH